MYSIEKHKEPNKEKDAAQERPKNQNLCSKHEEWYYF